LADDFLVPIILKTHHLCHLQLITSSFDLVKDRVPPSSHPFPVYPLSLYHWPLLVEIDRMVPVGVEKGPKERITRLLAAFIHKGFTIVIDCTLLHLLRVLDGHVGRPLNRCMPLKHLMVILILVAGVRRVVTWLRRRPTSHRRLVSATLLGAPGHILPMLCPFLMTRVHPEIREMR
jgi:hypothetical protein